MARRIALLVALLAALLVVVLGSLLAGRYYYRTLVQTSGLRSESQKVEQKEEQGSGSITMLVGFTVANMSLDGIHYDSEWMGRSLSDEDLGPKFADVRRETAPGTTKLVPVYAVKGYDTSFRLAARVGDHLILFEAHTNPKANEASDLLDIGGKVKSISIFHSFPTPLTLAKAESLGLMQGTIEDPEEVEQLIQGLMGAPLKPTGLEHYAFIDDRAAEERYHLIVFYLKDGTVVLRSYRTDTGRLANTYSASGRSFEVSGIVTPQAFRGAIKEALRNGEGELGAPPDSTLSYGGREVSSPPSASYCWGGGCADGVWTVPPRKQTLYVPSGSELVFRFGGQGPPNEVSASATELLGRVDTNGGGLGREFSLKASGSGMERTIPAELPPDEYLVDVHITAPLGDAPYIFRVVVQ